MKFRAGLLVGWLVVLYVVLFQFKTNTIECRLAESECPQSLRDQLTPLTSKAFFTTNIPREVSAHTSGYSLQHWSKKLPGTLVLEFAAARPAYYLNAGGTRILTNELGEVVSNDPGLPLPEIQVSQSQLTPDSGLNIIAHAAILDTLQGLQHIQLTPTRLLLANDSITLTTNNRQIILPLERSSERLASIPLLQSRLENQLSSYSVIDLRYKLPVLRN